jgi:two-component system alkaline phosphatase synthesis response regulator PhoP
MAYSVLIVEDEQAISRVIDLKLKQLGVSTILAPDGKQALGLITSQKFDCILLDLILPGLDGFNILEAIRQIDPYTKVIVMTNLGQPEDRARVQKLGVSGYFVKSETPITRLIEEVKNLLETIN